MLSNIGRAAIKRVGAGTSRSSTHSVVLSPWNRWVDGSSKAVNGFPGRTQFSLLLPRLYATATKATQTPAPKKTSTAKAKTTKATPKKAAKKPAKKPAKKKVKKALAKKPKAKPKAKPKKKVLTVEQQKRAEIRELKKTALSPPKGSPSSAWTVLWTEFVKQRRAGTSVKEIGLEASAKYKSLTPAELEQYNHQANQNKTADEIALRKWIETHTPDQIRLANNARKLLNKRLKGSKTRRFFMLQDPRLPKKAPTALGLFMADRWATGDFKGVPVTEALKILRAELSELPPSERKALDDRVQSDRQRYVQEYKTVYHRDSSSKGASV